MRYVATQCATARQNQQNGLCTQRRLRSPWASAQSDQSLRRALEDRRIHYADSEDSDQTVRMPRLIWVLAGRTCQLFGFVMLWLKYY